METPRNILKELKDENDKLKKDLVRKDKLLENITVIRGHREGIGCEASPEKHEDYFGLFFHLNPVWTVLSTLDDGIIVAANEAFYNITGYQAHEVLGRSAIALGLWPESKASDCLKQLIIKEKKSSSIAVKVRLKSGEERNLFGSAHLIETKEDNYILSVMIDISQQKALEEALEEHGRQVAALNKDLRDMNTAIRVFGDAWGREKAAIQNRINYHINVNVLPFIEKMKATQKKSNLRTYLRIIEENLEDLNPVFSDARDNHGDDFTPSESQIIQLVKHGKSSKEIAELLNLSTKAISFHRSNIRKKLNLVNKKTSLATYLRSRDVIP